MKRATERRARRSRPKPRANPLLAKWSTPFGIAPFERVEPGHFRPAFRAALAEHKAELRAITGSGAKPTFANTIRALEKSGLLLSRVARVFFNLASTDTNDELQAI